MGFGVGSVDCWICGFLGMRQRPDPDSVGSGVLSHSQELSGSSSALEREGPDPGERKGMGQENRELQRELEQDRAGREPRLRGLRCWGCALPKPRGHGRKAGMGNILEEKRLERDLGEPQGVFFMSLRHRGSVENPFDPKICSPWTCPGGRWGRQLQPRLFQRLIPPIPASQAFPGSLEPRFSRPGIPNPLPQLGIISPPSAEARGLRQELIKAALEEAAAISVPKKKQPPGFFSFFFPTFPVLPSHPCIFPAPNSRIPASPHLPSPEFPHFPCASPRPRGCFGKAGFQPCAPHAGLEEALSSFPEPGEPLWKWFYSHESHKYPLGGPAEGRDAAQG